MERPFLMELMLANFNHTLVPTKSHLLSSFSALSPLPTLRTPPPLPSIVTHLHRTTYPHTHESTHIHSCAHTHTYNHNICSRSTCTNILSSVVFTCGAYNNSSHIDIASVLGTTTTVYEHHLAHPNGHQEDHNRECGRHRVLEGISEPAVVARFVLHDYEVIKWGEVQVRKV